MDTEVKAKVEHEQDEIRLTRLEDPIQELGSVSKDTRSILFGHGYDSGFGYDYE